VFGVSFTEFLVIVVVGLIVLGPQKLPGLFRSIGQWVAKLRRLSTEVRAQSGIDEILRAEGLHGGISELRGLMRSELRGSIPLDQLAQSRASTPDPYTSNFEYDVTRERPIEGPDSYDALGEDLTDAKLDAELTSP
jgi:sec-independent protein translocase protein TatB